MIDTVLFDLDGTLVQHGHVLIPPLLRRWGHPRSPDYIEYVANKELEWAYMQAAPYGGEITLNVYRELHTRILAGLKVPDPDGSRSCALYDYFLGQPVPALFDDTLPLLIQLAAKGIRMGIVTQRGHNGTMKILVAHRLLVYFDAIICGDSGYGRKPTPGPFRAALIRLGSKPAHTIFVGGRIDDDCIGAVGATLRAFLIDRCGHLADAVQGHTDFTYINRLTALGPYVIDP